MSTRPTFDQAASWGVVGMIDHDDPSFIIPDILGDMAAQVARKLAADQDALIRDCITERIGAAWTLADVLPRLRWERERGRPEKVLLLDWVPILVIWPPQSHFETDGAIQRMNWTVNYRKITCADPRECDAHNNYWGM